MKKYFKMFVRLFLLSLLLSSCGEKAGIMGKVVDTAEKGLDSVVVTIENSSFKSITDREGNYLIDYVPGTFKLVFSKQGFTTHELELSISNKMKFPAKTIELYPNPKNRSIYLLKDGKLCSLKGSYVKERTGRDPNQTWGRYALYQVNNLSTIKADTTIDAGTLSFIDRYPEKIKFARLQQSGDIGIIQYYTYNWGSVKYQYNGLINDSPTKIGKENLLLRSVKVKPGFYAWVQVGNTLEGRVRPLGNKKCFVLKVISSKNK